MVYLKMQSKWRAWSFLVRCWILQNLTRSMKKYLLLYLKIIFIKKYEETMKHLQFKFDPLPAVSTEYCQFLERCLENLFHAKYGKLCIKYGIISFKIVVVHFWNIFVVGASQKNPFLALRKWKMFFLCK
jgi:hypothetical protein